VIRSNLMSQNQRVNLLWVVDVMEEIGGNLAKKYGAKFTKNLSEALEDTNVDAVWIAASTPFHMEAIRKSSAKGKHIFVEKPISLSTEDINEAFRVAKQNNVMLLVAWNRRSDPHYGKVREVIHDKQSDLGKL
jgi:myo-inositol 2-dehydrogenase / D-chiro-inositol 1-dehydrogenase